MPENATESGGSMGISHVTTGLSAYRRRVDHEWAAATVAAAKNEAHPYKPVEQIDPTGFQAATAAQNGLREDMRALQNKMLPRNAPRQLPDRAM